MGLFGPSKEERIKLAIQELGAAGPKQDDAARYLSRHFSEAWPQLDAALTVAQAVAQQKEMLAALAQAGLEPGERFVVRDVGRQAAAILRFCLPAFDKPEVATTVTHAALVLVNSGWPDAEQAAQEVLEAVGPALLPQLLTALPEADAGGQKAVRLIAQRYPDEMARLCRNLRDRKQIRAALNELAALGIVAEPAMDWVCRLLATREDVQKQALYAATAIGPRVECVPYAAALLERYPKAAAELLCAVRPQGLTALADKLPQLDEHAAGAALRALSAIGWQGHLAAAAVADLARTNHAVAEQALATLVDIGPSPEGLVAAESLLAAHPKAALRVLHALPEEGLEAIARHADELKDADLAEVLDLLSPDEVQRLLPRVAAMLAGSEATKALSVLARLGPAASPAAPALLDYYRRVGPAATAAALMKIADPSFLGPLLIYLYGAHPDHRLFAAEIRAFATTTPLSKALLDSAVEVAHLSWDGDYPSLADAERAVSRLAATREPAVSNILHLVAEHLTDITVSYETGCAIYPTLHTDETVSFEALRERARQELSERGDPPYDEAHFIFRRER